MNYLVVGAGFSGAVLARELAEKDHHITVIDKRDHIAGNAYDYIDELSNARIHMYGPHLFHTNNKEVWDYVRQFGTWVPYKHRVKAYYDGQYFTLPVNKSVKEKFSNEEIIDIFFRPYTKKMWGYDITELDPSIIKRVAARDDDNEFYFPNDEYQALPLGGYTTIIDNILDHRNIMTILETSFNKDMEQDFDHVFNSMAIDEYYDYEFGELPYRSIKFDTYASSLYVHPDAAVINFTTDAGPTRVTNWNRLPNSPGDSENLFTYEYPCDYKDNNFERYYPVKDVQGKNREIYEKYKNIKNDKVTFIGRCGQYVYIDMHQAINMSLQMAKRID